MTQPALLALHDGTLLTGRAFGARTTVVGEVVFNTCLTGYQEVITDPSYHGQMVCMTTPHVGNTGINPEDLESDQPRISAFIVREVSQVVSNWRAHTSLPTWLATHGIPGISEVDTRWLTRMIREQGVMHGALSTDGTHTADELLQRAATWPGLDGRDLVREVTCGEAYPWQENTDEAWRPVTPGAWSPAHPARPHDPEAAPRVVAYDFGIKHNILRRLVSHGLQVLVVPAHTTAAELLALDPDGIFLSNGPGDPRALPYAIKAVRELMTHDIPLFGICLGHQIIAQALGAEVFKLKFGHHGGNQPVSNRAMGNVQITSQNHNYSVTQEDLPANVEITHWNLNDQTVEGLRLKDRPVFCVQYHPEASPGPHDADGLFAQFAEQVKAYASARRPV